VTARAPHFSVRGLLAAHPEHIDLSLELIAGAAGLDRPITSPSIQKTGLALAGFHSYLQPGRVLIYGESELQYLESLPVDRRRVALAQCFAAEIPCVLVGGGGSVPDGLIDEANAAGLPLLFTPAGTAVAISRISALLGDRLAEREMVHGVLLEILGLGVLMLGESGIGKSECALDLVGRGHRLVADDTVEIRRREDMTLLGSCPPLTRNHMEVRGLGLINIRDLFGVAATRVSKRIELTVQLERWDPTHEYDRLGLDEITHDILGVRIPLIRMPVAPGRNLATLVEVAARNQLLRNRGIHAARQLAASLEARLSRGDGIDDRDGHDEDEACEVSV